MIYVYAFVERSAPADVDLRGLEGAPVELIGTGEVAAVCSRHDELTLRGQVDELWQHEAVTAGLLSGGAVVPARFGTVVADDDAVRTAVAELGPSLAATLRRLRGKVELGVRGQALERQPEPAGDPLAAEPVGQVPAEAAGQAPAQAPDRPSAEAAGQARAEGRGYLRRLATAHARPGLPGEWSAVHGALAELADRDVVLTADHRTLSAAYLIDGAAVEHFTRALVDQRRRHPGIRVSLTGPWAPYHFVDQEAMSHV